MSTSVGYAQYSILVQKVLVPKLALPLRQKEMVLVHQMLVPELALLVQELVVHTPESTDHLRPTYTLQLSGIHMASSV